MLLLDVAYKDKDQAKALGAKWCPEIKKWYSPDRRNYYKFTSWLDGGVIVCDQIYIVEGMRTCHNCKKQTKVIGFGFDKFFDVGSAFEDPIEGSICITNIESRLPDKLAQDLELRYGYKWDYSRSTKSHCNANHCSHCGSMQGNYFLFEEFDSPFFIDGKEAAEKLTLNRIRLHQDICIAASISFGSEDYLIKQYSRILESDLQWEAEMLPARLIAQFSRSPKEGDSPQIARHKVQQKTDPNKGIVQLGRCDDSSIQKSPYSWWKTLLLAVFFGWIGCHRFYVEKYWTWMLYLFTLGLFGIGWITDVICILKGTFTDSQGRKITLKR